MPRLEIPVGRSRAGSFRSGGMWVGKHFPPARCQWGGTQDVLMRLEPSSHSKPPASSPPPSSLLHAGTLWDIPPSPDQRGDHRAPPAAAPSPRGQHPREQSTGQIQAQGTRPGRERGNRRVRLCPAPAEKGPFQSYHNPGSGRPQPQRLSGDLPPPPGTCSGVLGHR